MAYTFFANYYDQLTGDVSYQERARYFDKLIRQNIDHVDLLLDLACGTGSLTQQMLMLGYDVIGVDASAQMLSLAASKAPGALFLCQDMAQLDLYGTVDVVICALDSLNHIADLQRLGEVFERVAMFTEPGGLFLFDVNTIYKHQAVLGNNTFFYETKDCCCVWQNDYCEKDHTVSIDLDFFVKEDGKYRRESEHFCERAYTQEELAALLKQAGLEIVALYEADTFGPPSNEAQRWVYVTRKLPIESGGVLANNVKTLKFRRKAEQ